MADQDHIQDREQTPTPATDTTSTTCVEEEQDVYADSDSDSDCGSDSSVVTVVHSPLEDNPLSNHIQSLSAAASTKASQAPLSSSSSSSCAEAQLPPSSIPLPASACRGSQRSSSLSSAFNSFFTGPEFELNPVQKPIRFATATTAKFPILEPQPVRPQTPATAEQFPVLEPRQIRPRPNTFQIPELPPRRHRVGSLVGPNSGIGSPPRFPAPPIPHRSSHHRSASASATYISSSSRHRSALAEQPPNFSLPLRGFQLTESTESFPKLLPATSRTPSAQPLTNTPLERRRTRARSNAVRGENPLEVPITTQEYQLANLVRTINQNNEREADQKSRQSTREVAGHRAVLERKDGYQDFPVRDPLFVPLEAPVLPNQGHRAATFSSRQPLPTPLEDPIDRSTTPTPRSYSASGSRIQSTQPSIDSALASRQQPNVQDSARTSSSSPLTSEIAPPTNPVELYITGQTNRETPGSSTNPKPTTKPPGSGDLQIWRLQLPPIPTSVLESIFADQHQALKRASTAKNMNFQSYGESPQGGPSNPRQAPPSPSQGMNHQNGVNGGMTPGAGLIGYPTPAGHQSDLNYVMSMVDELANVLRMNQQLTANVVDKMGKVREKAKHLNLSNDELMAAAAGEMSEEGQNMDKEISELRKSLEDSEYHKRENFKLAVHGAEILSDIAEKVHKFKASHEADTLAWHKNYRKQLADEREENLRLRNEMNDLKAGACRANEHMRDMRRYLSDNDERHELRVENHRLRTEKRFWKRLALPLIPDDDSEWSDDDDLIDPEEKTRLETALKEKERIAKDEAEGEGSGGPA